MRKKLKILIPSLMLMQLIGLGKISAQTVVVTIAEIRKANETKARLDSVKAVGNLVLMDLRSYQDSTKVYKDSSTYWKAIAFKFKRKRNFWRNTALIETLIIGSTFTKN